MSEVIPNFKSNRGRPELYDWAAWADGQARKLRQGEDFNAGLLSMRTMIHRKARSLGLRAFTHIDDVNKVIDVMFYE
jgi:hypothetical protein